MFGQPFGSNYADLQNQYMQQLQAMQQAQQAQQKTQPILDEINREVGSLSLDEQKVLATMQEYQMAKSTYEAGFMAFLGNKFSQEYVASPNGKIAADNLLASQAVITYVVKNMEDKYGKYLEIFTDVNGNINVDLLGNAAKAEMKDKYPDGYVTNIFGKPVKFNDEDITQLLNLFKQNK
jgi:hypothetical protein